MQARDIMTTTVAKVAPDTAVPEIVDLLLQRRISAVPVVDAEDKVLGMVSEGDLMRRHETGTERHRSWWLALFTNSADLAGDYTKSHGMHARDIMTKPVLTIAEDASLPEIAEMLESRRVKRLPVVRDGKMVGIVSRADLLRGLAAQQAQIKANERSAPAATDDRAIRENILAAIDNEAWVSSSHLNVVVSDGVVHLWGLVASDKERQALKVAAENTPGVKSVEQHLSPLPTYV